MYKITSCDNGSYAVLSKASVKYGREKWAEAPKWLAEKGYHLLVFETLDDTVNFVRPYSNGVLPECGCIWMCECEDEIDPIPDMGYWFDVGLGNLTMGPCGEWPPGTRMFKRVKLLHRISSKEIADKAKELEVANVQSYIGQ